MAELTKTVDGAALPASKFAYVGDPQNIATWHLPIDSDAHVKSALDLFAHEKHVPESQMTATAKKIAAEAKARGIDATNFKQKHLSSAEHAEASSPWVEIFRAGDYRPQGKSLITRTDLEKVVRNYDPAFHEAPVCVGHPKHDLPAYAWIDRLALDGDTLLAKEKQVDPQFAELRKAGKFKKRSAAFYQDAAGNVTGLRHVGWLGAQPPEVKGLQDVQFEDGDRKFIEMSFGEEESVADTTMEERLKTFFSELFGGGNKSTKTFNDDDVKRISSEAATAATAPLQAKITQLETDLTGQKTTFTEREQKIAGAEVKQRAIDAASRLKTAGKWIPAYEKMGLGLVFDELAKSTETVEFGEGDAKKKVTPLETLVLFLEGLPKIVPGGTTFTGASSRTASSGSGDPLTDLAKARAKEKSITYSEALDQIAQEQPELTRPGTSGAGAV